MENTQLCVNNFPVHEINQVSPIFLEYEMAHQIAGDLLFAS